MYTRYGIRAPFIFAIVCTTLDLFGRLIVIERKEALLWGFDPAGSRVDGQQEAVSREMLSDSGNHNHIDVRSGEKSVECADSGSHNTTPQVKGEPPSLLSVVVGLCKSPRALVALYIVLTKRLFYYHYHWAFQ